VTIKKTVRPMNLPGVHPGLMERLREAEEAEKKGELPKQLDAAQKILRPSLEATSAERAAQARSIGLVEPAWRVGVDGRLVLAEIPAYKPGVDLDATWDQMSEAEKIRAGATERFRLELEASLARAAMPYELPHKMAGRLDARNLSRAHDNLRAEIEAYGYLLAEDARALLERFVEETRALLAACLRQKAIALDAGDLYDILRDWVQKLVYQELSSRRRAMGDRGIRRICANIALADQVYERLKKLPGFSPRQPLLMRCIHVHQDLGHTAYAARVSYRGGKLHRAYGARIFTDEMNRYRSLFDNDELELARAAVATHSAEELPFREARVLALVRAVDHLAPVAPYRVWRELQKIDGVAPYLDDMLARLASKKLDQIGALKEHLARHLEERGLAVALRDDILASFRAFERLADPVDLGALAGEITGELAYDEAAQTLTARVQPDPWVQRYQILFDTQQEQLVRFAKNTGVALEQLRNAGSVRLAAPGSGALVINSA
jgi:hypothetical protein